MQRNMQFNLAEQELTKLNKEFPEKMKQSVLQYAVEGKLVPQIDTEEPASVLLEKIREEKEQLIKDKKIKRDKNESVIYREDGHFYEKVGKKEPVCIDDEIPFDIPASWEWVRLGNLINLKSGRDLNKLEYNDLEKGIPYITGASNIVDETLVINRWTEKPRVVAEKGDLLITCKGTIGTMCFCTEEVHIARQIMAIKTIGGDLLDGLFLEKYLSTQISYFMEHAKSMIPGISRDDILYLLFPLPPLKEQYRIVERIEEILPLIKEL